MSVISRQDVSTRMVNVSTTKTTCSPLAMYSKALLLSTVVRSAHKHGEAGVLATALHLAPAASLPRTVRSQQLQRQALIRVSAT